MQEEAGEEGTPHIQGVVYFRNPVSFATVKQWNLRLHVERTRDIHRSVKYCTDPQKRRGRAFSRGFSVPKDDLDLLEEDALYDWQRELLAELGGQPDRRTVIWYYDPQGGCGKTELCRYICAKYENALFLTSAAGKDLVHQIIKAKNDPRIVIMNISRQAEGKLSYASIESIKDGLVFSGKYEGGTRLFARPHIVIFSNWYPDIAALTPDRWDIRELLQNPPRVRRVPMN